MQLITWSRILSHSPSIYSFDLTFFRADHFKENMGKDASVAQGEVYILLDVSSGLLTER